jgi:uncharacterized membrane protein
MDTSSQTTNSLGTQPQNPSPDVNQDVEKNKDLAAFSYVYVMSVVLYVLKGKESPFIRYHSRQAMILFVLAIIVWFVPVIGSFLELVLLGAMVYGFFNAAQGLRNDVWLIGPLSRGEMSLRQAWKQLVEASVRMLHAFRSGMSDGKKNPTDPLANPAVPSTIPPDAKI